MLSDIDNYFFSQEEPLKSCLIFLLNHILGLDKNITEAWRYKAPFYCYNGKRFCYLWVHKKFRQPYIGIVHGKRIDHPDLLKENRSRMKILHIDPEKDIPVKKINTILQQAIETS